ncbi:bifunctional diguanylate cyclase/phosphodiesterase [Tolumonas lignilytica]|uniref:sensor domain-containing protein n=1 Tax=Tolumonas lignilytica TaxID=1283284 RepID=UPI0004679C66|nr:PAS domain S-box protein [Tolumonas lignilytica]
MQSIADTPALLNERITAIVHALATDATVPADQLLPLLTDISAYLQQQNEHNYRLFFELARVPILLIDPETRQIKNANRAAENFYGYSREQLLQLCITDINCLTPQQIREEMAHAEAERRAFFLFPHRLASGEIRQVEVHSGPIIIDGHEYLYSTIYDITERQQALIQLRDSEARYRALHDSLPVGCLTQDAEHNILAINDEACVIFGVDRAQLQNNNLASMPWVRVRENGEPLSLDEHPAVECLRTRTPVRGFIMGLKSEHHTVWLSVNSQPLYHPGETEPYAVISTFSDISELKQIEEKLSLAASVFTEAREAIMITDADARIVQINNAFCDITGYSQDEVLGQNPRLLQSGYQDTAFYHAFWRQLLEVGHWSGEIWNRRKNGDIFAEQQTISAVKNAKNETHHYVSLFSDISDRKQYEKQLEQQAFYDQLTGLPNRAQLTDKLTLAIQQNNHALTQLCVAYIDLDGFKQINDTYGHAVGDQVLVTIAQRMKKVLRGTDVVARLGGDEFVALFTVNQERPWLHLVTRLLNSIAKTLSIGTLPLNVSASIGLTFYQQASNLTAEQLLAQADQAMYQAKQAGRNQYQLYEAKLH